MEDDSFRVRTMLPGEVALAVDWAAAEGWNPGLTDASCFAAAAPDGFLLGEFAGAPAAILSVVNYDEHFSFLGFYIVRPDLRGRGLGLRIWQAGMARAGSRADITAVLIHVCFWGVKRTSIGGLPMSASDPKRTWLRSRLGATNGTILGPKM